MQEQLPRRRPSCHQARSKGNNAGESIAWRSRLPLPCSTRMIIRSLSMSVSFDCRDAGGRATQEAKAERRQTSLARNPAA